MNTEESRANMLAAALPVFMHAIMTVGTRRRDRISDLLKWVVPTLCEAADQRRQSGSEFDLFDVLGVRFRELNHSRFLRELLDPGGSHGQGYLFLQGFLDTLADLAGNPGLASRNSLVMRNTQVWTEKHLGVEGRLDLLLVLGDETLIAIENKIFASEQEGQVDRYSTWLGGQGTGEQNRVLVFLTPDGRKPSSGEHAPVVCLSYADIASWLSRVQDRIPDNSNGFSAIVEKYRCLCLEIAGEDKAMLDNDVLELVMVRQNFRAALELEEYLAKAKEEVMKTFWSRVRDLLKAKLNLTGHDSRWEVVMDNNIFQKNAGVWIGPDGVRSGTFSVGVFSIGYHQETYLSVNRPSDRSPTLKETELSEKISTKRGYNTNEWFLGWINTRDTDIGNISLGDRDAMWKMCDDNFAPKHGFAEHIAQTIFDLFAEYRPDLEELNQITSG
jgi:hypothetical protein